MLIIFGVVAMFAATFANTGPTQFACAYGGGLIESKARKGPNPVKPSSGRVFIGLADTVVYLRSDVRNYIVDRSPDAGDVPSDDFIKTPTGDGVEVVSELNVRFRINYDKGCKFWEEHGRRFKIDTDEGWSDFLAQNLRPILDNAYKSRVQRTADWEDIWRNQVDADGVATWTKIQDDVGAAVVKQINDTLGDNYLCGVTWSSGSDECPPFEVLIKSVVPEDQDLTNRYTDIQKTQTATEQQAAEKAKELAEIQLTAQNDLEKANAQLAVSQANLVKAQVDAQVEAAQCVELAKAGVDCVMLEAAKNGQTEFWVTDGQNPQITRTVP